MEEKDMLEMQKKLEESQALIEKLLKEKEESEIRESAQKEMLENAEKERLSLKGEIASVKRTNFILSNQGNGNPEMTPEEAIAGMFGLKKKE